MVRFHLVEVIGAESHPTTLGGIRVTKDQKALLLFHIDNILDLAEGITPEKRTELIQKMRDYVDDITNVRKRLPKDAETELKDDDEVFLEIPLNNHNPN